MADFMIEFGGIGYRKTLHVSQDQLVFGDLRIPASEIVAIQIVENPLTLSVLKSPVTLGRSASHYDLEILTTDKIFHFPNSGLMSDSEALLHLKNLYSRIKISEIRPLVQINGVGKNTIQLFPNYLRIKSFEYSLWPYQCRTYDLAELREVKFIKQTSLSSDAFIQWADQTIHIQDCMNAELDEFLRKLDECKPGVATKILAPLCTRKYIRNSKIYQVAVNEEGLMWEKNLVLFKDITSLVFIQPSSFTPWELQISTQAGTFSIPGIQINEAPPLKDMIEALNPDLQITVRAEMGVEENAQAANSFLLRTILVVISAILIILTSILIVKSDLPSNAIQRLASNQQTRNQESSSSPFWYLVAPLIGVLLFGGVYSMARDLKEKTLNDSRMPENLNGRSSVERVGNLQRLAVKITPISGKSEDRYDPLTQTLCLTPDTLDSHSLSTLVLIAHEIAHFAQSKWIGNTFLRIIKSFEALIKSTSRYLLFFFGSSLLILLLLGPEMIISQFLLVLVVLVYLFEIFIMGISLLVEMDADRRSFGILKHSRLMEKSYSSSIFLYLLLITAMRVLLFIAFFIPTFGAQFRHFQDNKTIRI